MSDLTNDTPIETPEEEELSEHDRVQQSNIRKLNILMSTGHVDVPAIITNVRLNHLVDSLLEDGTDVRAEFERQYELRLSVELDQVAETLKERLLGPKLVVPGQ